VEDSSNEHLANEPFSNEPVDVTGLPILDDGSFVPMHPNFLRVTLIGHGTFAIIALAVGAAAAVLVPSRTWIPLLVMGAVLLLTALSASLKTIEVKNIAYQVREHDVSYRSGVLVKTVETVPFVRVQHARITQGPVQRRFGLATLEVNSAGPELNIHGLTAQDAERLKVLVVERAGALVEES
jgi:membrane protein YdbS with pleckstrin-like domain